MKRSDATKPRFEAVTPRIPVLDIEEALTLYRIQLDSSSDGRGAPQSRTPTCAVTPSVLIS
jgi:hypothetical protein